MKDKCFQPLGKRILVKLFEEKEETESKQKIIIVPDSAKKKQDLYEVIAIGEIENNAINIGSIILVEKYSAKEVLINEEEFFVVKYEDIIGVIKHADKLEIILENDGVLAK